MYKNIYYDRNTNNIHLWDDTLGYLTYRYEKYAYIRTDKQSDYKSLFNENLSKVYNVDDYNKEALLESDVKPEMRILIDKYLQSDEPSKDINIMFYDIEVETKGKFPKAQFANNKITAISYYINVEKKLNCLLLNDKSTIKFNKEDIPNDYNVLLFDTEQKLLEYFIHQLKLFNINIITGWNIKGFDNPYIHNRIIKVFGKKYVNKLSPIGIVKYDDKEHTVKIAGIDTLDYIDLYKQFNQNEEPSYSLEEISQKELKRGKIKFEEEGTLDELFKTNIVKAIKYSVTDTELVKSLDDKLNFIELARSICHKGHVPYEEVNHSSVWLEGAALTFLHRKNIIANNKKAKQHFEVIEDTRVGVKYLELKNNIIIQDIPYSGTLKIKKTKTSEFTVKYTSIEDNKFILGEELPEPVLQHYQILISLTGAYVKDPQTGLHKWIYDLDLTSLYPSIMMSLNISYETKIGRILEWNENNLKNRINKDYTIVYRDGHREKLTSTEFFSIIDNELITIASNGVMYDNSKTGFIPSILEIWFGERVEFKNLMKKYKQEGNKELSNYYNIRQWMMKIMLNAFYGAMALQTFRFNDMDNAEAVTSTGQSIIKFSGKAANLYYNNITNQNKDYVLIVDTDSLFLSSLPLLNNYKELTDEQLISETIRIAEDTQKFINESYDIYVNKFHNIKGKHNLFIKQELVAKSAIFVAKKRYALNVISEEGVFVNNKLKVTGLDIVRSDFPKSFKDILQPTVIDILNDVPEHEITKKIKDTKNKLKDLKYTNLKSLLMNTGVNDIEQHSYSDRNKFQSPKGAPVHVKAGLFHNDFLKYYNLIEYDDVNDNDKIKWTYLKDNKFHIDTIAIKEQDKGVPKELLDFIIEYIDVEKNFESKLKNKLEQLYDVMKWDFNEIDSKINSEAKKLFDF